MRYIKITVHGQMLFADAEPVLSGSRNLYGVEFVFETETDGARYVQFEKEGVKSVYLPIGEDEKVAIPNEFYAEPGVIRVTAFTGDLATMTGAEITVMRSAYASDTLPAGSEDAGVTEKCVFTPTDETGVTVIKNDAEGFKIFSGGQFVRVGSKNDYTDADKALVGLIPSKADEADLEDCLETVGTILRDKVDKVEGKDLSTNDYTDYAKELLETWMPQEFDWITERVGTVEANAYNNYLKKVDKVEGKGLSTNDYTHEDKAEVAKIANKVDKPSQKGILSNESAVGVITLVKSTTMPEEPSDYMIPTTKLLKDYVGDKSNPLQLSDTDKTKAMVLIQHNYDSETQTEKYIARSIDVNNLSESGLAAYNIPTSKAVISWVKAYIESLNQSGGA
ncbi:MAG: hypothetical protein PUA50_03355 [Eubacteriales bacterium]|nr:hypothetical protein [Eubacteriales bacterium]